MKVELLIFLFFTANSFFACGNSQFAGGSGIKKSPKKTGGSQSTDDDPNKVFNNDDPSKQPPKFGMLVNDLKCSFCHLKVRGDVISLSDVNPVWAGSVGEVTGKWITKGQWKANQCVATNGCGDAAKDTPSVTINGQKLENTASSPLYPKDPETGAATFPLIDWDAAKAGSKQVFSSNKVLTGTAETPLEVTGDIYVEGDLIIKGRYRGAGTIYVTGNVYIPANLTAMNSPFPFSENAINALGEAEQALKDKKDALAIASAKSIIVGSFERRIPGDRNTSVFTHVHTPTSDTGEALGILQGNSWLVYNWHPKAQFDTLWDTTNPANDLCTNVWGNQSHVNSAPMNKYISRIDSFLYAVKAIAGRANNSSYAINGGIIADHFHVITGAGHCAGGNHPIHGYAGGNHPIHGYESNKSHINYDWRLQNGLGLLTHMGKYFQQN
jgi:hypothetical protein